MFTSIVEKLAFHRDINTVFFELLDHGVAISVIRCLNRRFYQNLPLHMEILHIHAHVLRNLKHILFPKVQKLDLVSRVSQDDKSLLISKTQFPRLCEVHDVQCSFFQTIIEKDISLVKFRMSQDKVPIIPIQSLHELVVHDAFLFPIQIWKQLLSDDVHPPLKKLTIPVFDTKDSNRGNNHNNNNSNNRNKDNDDVDNNKNRSLFKDITSLLCKFKSLEYVNLTQCDSAEVKYDFSSFFTKNNFSELVIFEYMDKQNSYIFISNPNALTKLVLHSEELCCIHSIKPLVFPQLREIEIEGDIEQLIVFLEILGQPLYTSAPNLEVIAFHVYSYNEDTDPFVEKEIIETHVFDAFSDKTKFLLLRELYITLDSFQLKVVNRKFLKKLCVISSSENWVSLIHIRDCPFLTELQICTETSVTTLINLPSLQKLVCENGENTQNDWKEINATRIKTLRIELSGNHTFGKIVRFIQESRSLVSLEIICHFRGEKLTTFIASLFSSELKARLKKLRIVAIFEELSIGIMPVLEELIVECRECKGTMTHSRKRQKSCFFILHDLPKLLKLTLNFLGQPKNKPIPVELRNLPLCEDISVFQNIDLILEGNCSHYLQETRLQIPERHSLLPRKKGACSL